MCLFGSGLKNLKYNQKNLDLENSLAITTDTVDNQNSTKEFFMGRIMAQVKITNMFDNNQFIDCSMFVDTGSAVIILPIEWKTRLGKPVDCEPIELELANGQVIKGETCSPFKIQAETFRPVFNEVIFMEMEKGRNGEYEPLLGYVPLEQIPVAVDMLGHRLIPLKTIDAK